MLDAAKAIILLGATRVIDQASDCRRLIQPLVCEARQLCANASFVISTYIEKRHRRGTYMQPRDEMQSPPSAFPSVDVVCPHGDLGVRRGRLQQRATSTFAELSQGPNYAWSITAVRGLTRSIASARKWRLARARGGLGGLMRHRHLRRRDVRVETACIAHQILLKKHIRRASPAY